MINNPKWTRDELILALDLYFNHSPSKLNPKSPNIIKLSDILNALPIHPQKSEYEKFRNPNGVYMKLCNFLRFDPTHKGKGLKGGGKMEENVWDEFHNNREKLSAVAKAIIQNAESVPRPSHAESIDPEEEFSEGQILTKLHKIKERSPTLAKNKKKAVLKEKGKLSCEVCGFDFEEVYGQLGKGFAECHHIKPIAELKGNEMTKQCDLCILCANCHRMIHKSKPMLSIDQLREKLNKAE